MPKANSLIRYPAWLSIVLSLGLVIFAIYLLRNTEISTVLAVAIIAIGLVGLFTAKLVLGGSRAGWSFALSLHGTLAVCSFFGAPKIRDTAEIGIGTALIPFAIFAALTTFYALCADDS